MKLSLLILALMAGASYAQGTYKCAIGGKTVYQDKPCFAAKNEPPLPTEHKRVPPLNHDTEMARIRHLQNQIELFKKEEAERQRLAAEARSKSKTESETKRTALSFDAYTNIRSGMNTQEVLLKAGTPSNKDFASTNARCQWGQIYESWLYPADDFESNHTIVEFCDNVVVNVKRFK